MSCPTRRSSDLGPQTPHGRISVIEISTARPNGARLSIIGSAAKVSSAAAVSPGITAAATGTGRPPTTGNQRGNTSPQGRIRPRVRRSEEHTSELQSRGHLVCRLLLEKKKN